MRKYREIVEHQLYNRNRIIEEASFKNIKRNHPTYLSMYNYSEDIISYIRENKSISDYIGKVNMSTFWIDIDVDAGDVNLNIKASMVAAVNIVNRLHNQYQLPLESLAIYFSGNKGFHIGIPAKVIGIEDFWSETLPMAAKNFCEVIVENTNVDYKIYHTTRVFRCPLSKHDKTQYYKIPISYKTLFAGNIRKILEDSIQCKIDIDYEYVLKRNDLLSKQFEISVNKSNNEGSVTDMVKVSRVENNNKLFHIPDKGNRNNTLYRQTYRLFNTILNTDEVVDIMRLFWDVTNSRSKEKMTELEFKIMIDSAYRRTRVKKLNNYEIQLVSDMVLEAYNEIVLSQHTPTEIKEIDLDLGGGLVCGDLYPFIGHGGTFKSIIAQLIQTKNAISNPDFSAVYLNQEMSKKQYVERAIRYVLKTAFKEQIRLGGADKSFAEEIMHNLIKTLGERLHVVSRNNITAEDIINIVDEIQDKTGNKISNIVVDSFNTMKQINSNISINTLEVTSKLKEASKKCSISTILINHVTGLVDKYVRDPSLAVRGGTKILDNADAVFLLSLIVDPEISQFIQAPYDLKPKRNFFYLRFYNKRESGNTVDKVMKFNPETFDIEETQLSPSEIEIKYLKDQIPNYE